MTQQGPEEMQGIEIPQSKAEESQLNTEILVDKVDQSTEPRLKTDLEAVETKANKQNVLKLLDEVKKLFKEDAQVVAKMEMLQNQVLNPALKNYRQVLEKVSDTLAQPIAEHEEPPSPVLELGSKLANLALDDTDDASFLEALTKLMKEEDIVKAKINQIKSDIIDPTWQRYKSMVDQVSNLDDEKDVSYFPDKTSDNIEHELEVPIVLDYPNNEDLTSLYNIDDNVPTVDSEGELGPNEGSSAALISGMTLSDIIVIERCPKTSSKVIVDCYCSRITQWSCPPGYFCMAPNHKEKCGLGFYCPEDTFQPTFCCGGYYCPSPKETIVCPKGHYCQYGSIEPRKCYFGNCPEGSKTIRKYEIFIFFIVFLVVVWIFYTLKARQQKFKKLEYDRQFDQLTKPIVQVTQPDSKPHSTDTEKAKKLIFDIKFNNLGLKLPNGVEIMKEVSGRLASGRTCAIMGPSGAGKTTFVSLITGKVNKTSGQIFINDKLQSLSIYRKLVGFVPQEDVMLRKLNVEEVLMHSAMMRLPVEWSEDMKRDKVLSTIEYLGLRHVMHHIIGDEEERGISGGQRKRVNIGMELVAEPSILFLDEPTSGLDSSTSVEVCRLLRDISRSQGLTIAAVIHSPSPVAFNLFDDLLLLGKGGRVIYHGIRAEAVHYFEQLGFECPKDTAQSDYFMDIATGKIENNVIPEFAVPDLYELWAMKYESDMQGTPFTIEPFIVPRLAMSDYSKPPFPSFTYEDCTRSLNEDSAQTFDGDSKEKGFNCLVTCSQPMWQKYLNQILGPGISYLAVLFMDILSWSQSVFNEFKDSIIGVYQWGVGNYNDPIRNTPGSLTVFLLCLNRAFIQIFRPPMSFVTDQLLHLGCGFFISIAAQNSVFLGPLPDVICRVTSLPLIPKCTRPIIDQAAHIGNFVSWGIGFAGIAVGAGTFGNERVVYWRETASGMPTFPYFLAKSLSDLPRLLIASLMFTMALIAVYPNMSSFQNLYWIIASLYYWGFSTGYLISALVRREQASLVGVVVALFWAIAFSGVQPTLREIMHDWGPGVTWLWDISAPRWAISAFYIAETEGKRYMDPNKVGHRWYGFQDDTMWGSIFIVVKIALVWQFLALIALKLANRDKMK